MKENAQRKEFGDFQTPLELAKEVCALVRERSGNFDAIIEPTCGVGAFVRAAASVFGEAAIVGHEINPGHLAEAVRLVDSDGFAAQVTLRAQDFFSADWSAILTAGTGRLLLLGNPPWVTSAEVTALGGANLPVKKNFQGLKGLSAKTGKANFDISEWMLIHLMELAMERQAVMAMLCKTATARKVLKHAWQKGWKVANAALYRIDAQEHFGASVDACLFVVEMGVKGPSEALLFGGLRTDVPPKRFGLVGRDLVTNLDAYGSLAHLEGAGPFRWRSGIKHDCAAVMEFTRVGDDEYQNGLGEIVTLEREVMFPLLKSTGVFHCRTGSDRWLLVPQRRVGESTRPLATTAPMAWRYLQGHADRFAARKSSIYRSGDAFAIFGIGPYAFLEWKVAISGLHRPPRFQVIPPWEGSPVMFDDTCYFVSFGTGEEAEVVARAMNSEPCLQFIEALTLPEAKRPITVELLHRINFARLVEEAGLQEDWAACERRAVADSPGVKPAQMELL